MSTYAVNAPTAPQAQHVLRPDARARSPCRVPPVIIQPTDAKRELQGVRLLEAADIAHARRLVRNAVPSEVHLPPTNASDRLGERPPFHIDIPLRGTVIHATHARVARMLFTCHAEFHLHVLCQIVDGLKVITAKSLNRHLTPSRQRRHCELTTSCQPSTLLRSPSNCLKEIRLGVPTVFRKAIHCHRVFSVCAQHPPLKQLTSHVQALQHQPRSEVIPVNHVLACRYEVPLAIKPNVHASSREVIGAT